MRGKVTGLESQAVTGSVLPYIDVHTGRKPEASPGTAVRGTGPCAPSTRPALSPGQIAASESFSTPLSRHLLPTKNPFANHESTLQMRASRALGVARVQGPAAQLCLIPKPWVVPLVLPVTHVARAGGAGVPERTPDGEPGDPGSAAN